jgi:hypothetical protein
MKEMQIEFAGLTAGCIKSAFKGRFSSRSIAL